MGKTNKIILAIILILAVIAILCSLFFVVVKKGGAGWGNIFGTSSDKYYLVYIANGASSLGYYGQITKNTDDLLVLKNPGYINVQAAAEEGGQPQVSFNQLKDEFFKPMPEITINKNYVVFIQELASDSPVVKAYADMK